MMADEKGKLLGLFASEANWCQHCEARDQNGDPVRYDDKTAVAWDLVGGMCHLFGWRRACELFGQMHRHLNVRPRPGGNRDEDMVAMADVFDFNDALDTTYVKVVATIQDLPIWRGRGAAVPQ